MPLAAELRAAPCGLTLNPQIHITPGWRARGACPLTTPCTPCPAPRPIADLSLMSRTRRKTVRPTAAAPNASPALFGSPFALLGGDELITLSSFLINNSRDPVVVDSFACTCKAFESAMGQARLESTVGTLNKVEAISDWFCATPDCELVKRAAQKLLDDPTMHPRLTGLTRAALVGPIAQLAEMLVRGHQCIAVCDKNKGGRIVVACVANFALDGFRSSTDRGPWLIVDQSGTVGAEAWHRAMAKHAPHMRCVSVYDESAARRALAREPDKRRVAFILPTRNQGCLQDVLGLGRWSVVVLTACEEPRRRNQSSGPVWDMNFSRKGCVGRCDTLIELHQYKRCIFRPDDNAETQAEVEWRARNSYIPSFAKLALRIHDEDDAPANKDETLSALSYRLAQRWAKLKTWADRAGTPEARKLCDKIIPLIMLRLTRKMAIQIKAPPMAAEPQVEHQAQAQAGAAAP